MHLECEIVLWVTMLTVWRVRFHFSSFSSFCCRSNCFHSWRRPVSLFTALWLAASFLIFSLWPPWCDISTHTLSNYAWLCSELSALMIHTHTHTHPRGERKINLCKNPFPSGSIHNLRKSICVDVSSVSLWLPHRASQHAMLLSYPKIASAAANTGAVTRVIACLNSFCFSLTEVLLFSMFGTSSCIHRIVTYLKSFYFLSFVYNFVFFSLLVAKDSSPQVFISCNFIQEATLFLVQSKHG